MVILDGCKTITQERKRACEKSKPSQFCEEAGNSRLYLADESLVNRIMGNFLIDGYESKSYGLKMVNRTDGTYRPNLYSITKTQDK